MTDKVKQQLKEEILQTQDSGHGDPPPKDPPKTVPNSVPTEPPTDTR